MEEIFKKDTLIILTNSKKRVRNTDTGFATGMAKYMGEITRVGFRLSSMYDGNIHFRTSCDNEAYAWSTDSVYAIFKNDLKEIPIEFEYGATVKMKELGEITTTEIKGLNSNWVEFENVYINSDEYKSLIQNKIGKIEKIDRGIGMYQVQLRTRKVWVTKEMIEISEEEIEEKIEKVEVEDSIIEEMIKKVDIAKMKKILASAFRKKSTSLKGVDVLLREWAEAKKEIYVLFGNKLEIEKEIESDMNISLFKTEIKEFVRTYPYTFSLFDEGTAEWIMQNKFHELRDRFHDWTGISRRTQKFSIALKNYIKGIEVIENISDLSEEEQKKYLELKSKVKTTPKVEDDFSKLIAKTKVKGHIKISINPIDYIMMSCNQSGWSSCYSICKNGESQNFGEYVAGLFAYMTDPTTLIAYRHSDKKYEFNIGTSKIEEYSKNWRQVIYLDTNTLEFITSREYPNHIDEVAKTVREMLEKQISEKMNIENKWTISRVRANLDDLQNMFENCGVGYNDIRCDNCLSEAKYVTVKDRPRFRATYRMVEHPTCPVCGEERIRDSESAMCYCCED